MKMNQIKKSSQGLNFQDDHVDGRLVKEQVNFSKLNKSSTFTSYSNSKTSANNTNNTNQTNISNNKSNDI